MPIEIREDLSVKDVKITEANNTGDTSLNLSFEDSLTVINEGLHAIATKNFTRYQASALKKSVPSWTEPYMKPVIMHHNEYDGKTIGRIQSVEYATKNTRSGTPALRFTLSIGDWDGQSQIQDGRLLTTSVGISASDCRCSICSQNIAEERCEHERGQIYEDQTCYWDIYEFEGKELSYVITPSDPYAANIQIMPRTYTSDMKSPTSAASRHIIGSNTTGSLTEGVNIQQPKQNPTTTIVEREMNKENITETNTAAEGAVTTPVTEAQVTTDPAVTDPVTPPVAETPPAASAVAITESQPPSTPPDNSLNEMVIQLQGQLTIEKQLREQLETTYNDVLVQYKKELSEKINHLRKTIGKVEIEENVLLSRSVDSLKDSIADINAEASAVQPQAAAQGMQTPTIKTLIESTASVVNPANVVPVDDKHLAAAKNKNKPKKIVTNLEGVVNSLFNE